MAFRSAAPVKYAVAEKPRTTLPFALAHRSELQSQNSYRPAASKGGPVWIYEGALSFITAMC